MFVPRREAASTGGFAALLLAVVAATAGAHTFEQPDRVLVDTSGNSSERTRSIPIRKKRGKTPRVVMSQPLEPLGLIAGDRLIANAEVQVTTDCRFELPRCVGNPYGYNPKIKAKLVLATGQEATKGPGTTVIGSMPGRRCRHLQHHCVIVFPGAQVDIDQAAPPECLVGGTCFANVVLSAHNNRAKLGDRLIIGEDEPDGRVVGDKGRVNAIRLRPVVAGPEPPAPVTTLTNAVPQNFKIPINEKLSASKVSVISLRLDDLRANEQISVKARMGANLSSLPRYKQLVNSRLILARSPKATRPNKLIKSLTEDGGELAEANGFNCSKQLPRCLTRKVGVSRLIADARDRKGKPIPLYVNLVAGSKGGEHGPDAAVTVSGARIDVVRYPAERHG